MDRSSPTDPPDRPVNRIREYWASMEPDESWSPARKIAAVISSMLAGESEPMKSLAAMLGLFADCGKDRAELREILRQIHWFPSPISEESEKALQGLLADLSKKYQMNPKDPEVVLRIAIGYLETGRREDALQYLEWYEKIRPDSYPSLERFASFLREEPPSKGL